MTNAELAKEILRLVGGERNILHVTNCVTRLRFALKDETKAETSLIEQLDGVLGVQSQGGQYQVILGGKVQKVANELGKIVKLSAVDASEETSGGNKNILMSLIDTLSAILTPVLPPVIAGGMLKGLTFMFTNFGWVAGDSDTMLILNLIADCMFHFFPFLLAVSSARKFKTNEYMALAVAGALMYPTITSALADGRDAFQFLGFVPIALVNYKSSVIPIILSVYLLKHVYDFFVNIIPDMVSMIFSPLLTLIIVIPVSLAALAPLGFYFGEYIAIGIQNLTDFSPLIAGFVFGFTRPLLVIGGMHHALNPIAQQQLATYGYNTMLAMSLMGTIAQATAAFAAYILIKDKKTKQVALSATVSGYIGITEPALYGIIIKYREILWATMLGGGTGAAVAMVMGGKCYGFAMPGLLTLPVFMGEGFTGILVGIITSFITTFGIILVFAKKINAGSSKITDGKAEKVAGKPNADEVPTGEISYIQAPAEGTLKALSEVKDATFARGIVGKGIAIVPNNDEIVSPVDGEIVMCFKTNHAIGLKTTNGVEILIHVGINTVEMEGKGFELLVAKGEKVTVGTPLLKIDHQAITAAGFDNDVIVVVTNYQEFLQVLPVNEAGMIFKGEQLLSVIK